jgi:hypothetical protein
MTFSQLRILAVCSVILAAQAIFFAQAIACENTSYCEPIDIGDHTPSISKQPAFSQLTVLGLQLQMSSVEDMRRRLGDANAMHQDECGGRDFCFGSADGDDPTTLIVDAWGTQLCSFTVLSTRIENEHCVKSHLVNRALVTNGGLKLGMTLNEIERLLCKPSQATPDAIAYSFLTHPRMTDSDVNSLESTYSRADIANQPFFDDWTIVQAGIQGSHVKCFRVQNTETW